MTPSADVIVHYCKGKGMIGISDHRVLPTEDIIYRYVSSLARMKGRPFCLILLTSHTIGI